MADQFRIIQRPQVQRQTRAPQEVVAAQPLNWTVGGAPAPDHNLAGLLQGLSALNPALHRYTSELALQEKAEAEKTKKADHLGGGAVGQAVENPREALTGAPLQGAVSLPIAVSDDFRSGMNEQLSHRAAIQIKDTALGEFNELKGTPDFEPTAWLAEKRRGALAGITDPASVQIIGAHFSELEGSIRGEVRRLADQRRDEIRTSTVSQLAADMFTADMDASRITEAYPQFLSSARRAGFSSRESAQFLFTQLSTLSNRLEGAPELFEVFDQKDSEGMTLVARNPQLAPHIDQARQAAKVQRSKALETAAEQGNAKALMAYEGDIDTRPEAVTMERILADMTPHGAIRSPQQAAALWDRAQDAMRKQSATEMFQQDGLNGRLWMHEPKLQGQVLDKLAGPLVQQLAKASSEGNQQGMQQAAVGILQMHTRSGATIAVDQLQRYVKTLVTQVPQKEVPPAFMAASELYKALSAYPQYRSMYFDEEASKVLDSFNASAGNGSDPKSAYVQAYQAISPEAKAAADLYVSTPAFKKMAAEESQKWVTGSGMNWLRLFGGNGRPQNPEIIGASVMWEMRSWRARNPHATAEQAAEYAEHWTEKNFVIDKASRTAVRIPPGVSAPAVQEAISANSKRIIDQMKLSERSDADWSIQYLPTGTEGNFNVVAFNGSSMHQMGAANIQTLLANHAARTQLDAAERTALGSLRVAVRDGTALPQLDTRLIAKAEALGILKPAEVKAYRGTLQSQLMGRLESVPKLSFGAPAADGLQFMAAKPLAVDKQLTAKVALEFAASPMFAAGTQHVGLAASLISMGEGVVLGAYDDPAQGAGKNIGMGYNLKANEKTASSDLKRAGVPEERIAQVIKGEAQLTADQAKRLLQVAMPRYEKQAQETAEASSPGLWSRMAPAQKAVMIDVAWQTGNPEKFKKAWAAVVAGDSKALAEETRVFYTDRNGERREDVRRNSLRASMLAGVSTWEALVSSFGKAPSSKVQAAALGTSK